MLSCAAVWCKHVAHGVVFSLLIRFPKHWFSNFCLFSLPCFSSSYFLELLDLDITRCRGTRDVYPFLTAAQTFYSHRRFHFHNIRTSDSVPRCRTRCSRWQFLSICFHKAVASSSTSCRVEVCLLGRTKGEDCHFKSFVQPGVLLKAKPLTKPQVCNCVSRTTLPLMSLRGRLLCTDPYNGMGQLPNLVKP